MPGGSCVLAVTIPMPPSSVQVAVIGAPPPSVATNGTTGCPSAVTSVSPVAPAAPEQVSLGSSARMRLGGHQHQVGGTVTRQVHDLRRPGHEVEPVHVGGDSSGAEQPVRAGTVARTGEADLLGRAVAVEICGRDDGSLPGTASPSGASPGDSSSQPAVEAKQDQTSAVAESAHAGGTHG